MKTYGRKKLDDKEDVIVNLDELCRLCLAKEEQLVPIFNEKEPIPLPIRIMACVALEVVEDDGLPSMICHPCHYQLEKYYVFRKKCESSDHKLRAHLKRLTGNSAIEKDSDNEITNDSGLTAITLVIPEDGEPDPEQYEIDEDHNPDESITLPEDPPDSTRTQCTLNKGMMGGQVVSDTEDDDGPILEANEINAVATAVRASLDAEVIQDQAGIPIMDDTMSLRLLPNEEGAATHVEVMTEDGSLLLMELTIEDPEFKVESENLMDENGEFKVLKCPECPKSFARKVQLKRHSSVHTLEKGLTCSVCEKWFPSRSALTRHERIHTGEKPFQCGVCSRSFAQKEILFRHFLTHSDNKPFECEICSKGFTQKEAWKSHMSTHTQRPSIKLHGCNLCPKIFCHASGLSRHLITHTGRNYRCLDCNKPFSDKSSLRRHHRVSGHQNVSS